jgi:hypothetical protein
MYFGVWFDSSKSEVKDQTVCIALFTDIEKGTALCNSLGFNKIYTTVPSEGIIFYDESGLTSNKFRNIRIGQKTINLNLRNV